jgi:hypothetical protein
VQFGCPSRSPRAASMSPLRAASERTRRLSMQLVEGRIAGHVTQNLETRVTWIKRVDHATAGSRLVFWTYYDGRP